MPGDGDGLSREGNCLTMGWYRQAVFVFGALFLAIGVAILVVTAVNGGGVVGFVMGGLFLALGVARIQLERKRRG